MWVKILKALSKIMNSFVGLFQSSLNRTADGADTGAPFRARNVAFNDPVVGEIAIANYEFVSDTFLEDNEPLYTESIRIAGVPLEGNILTANFFNLIIPNGGTEGVHTWRWYRAADKQQSAEELIVGVTTNQYTVTVSDAGYYIRCEADLVQIGGLNTLGETAISKYTNLVDSALFNPITNISWDTAYMSPNLTRFAELGYWTNRGNSGNTIAEGTPPVYDNAEEALRFTRTSGAVGNHFIYPKAKPSWSQPFEIWVRFKTATLINSQRIISFTSSMSIYLTSVGAVGVSGGVTGVGQITNGVWSIMRIIHNTVDTTVQVNNGVVSTITSGVNIGSPSTGNARIGSDLYQNNHFDGWISHVFIKGGTLDNATRDLMWAWTWNQ